MTFYNLTSADDRTLHWRQPDAIKWQFVPAADVGRTFGKVEVTSWLGNKVLAESAQGQWFFDQVGLWKPTLRAVVGEELVATFEVANAWLANRASLFSPSGEVIAQ